MTVHAAGAQSTLDPVASTADEVAASLQVDPVDRPFPGRSGQPAGLARRQPADRCQGRACLRAFLRQ